MTSYYNWDGTYHQIVKDAVAADGYQVDTTFNYTTMAEAYRVAAYNGLNRLA